MQQQSAGLYLAHLYNAITERWFIPGPIYIYCNNKALVYTWAHLYMMQ